MADEIVVMRSGRIVESGKIERVLGQLTSEYTRMLLAASEGRLPEEAPCG
ncbi:MAG: hypothetical protein ACLGI5_12090 [Thermoleophilia bacterium]